MAEPAPIVRVETFARGPFGLVRVTDAAGASGWGQMGRTDADVCATLLHRHVAPAVLGWHGDDPGAVADEVARRHYKHFAAHLVRAVAGVDLALWELRAQRGGVPVSALLSDAPRRSVAVYASSMSRDVAPADEAARMRSARDELGVRAFKCKIGKRMGADEDQWPGRSEALIVALRRALGDDVSLKADGNGAFSARRAIAIGRELEAHGFDHFEEPCPFRELEATAEVAAALDMDVAGGEQDDDLAQWRRMIAMRAVDVVQPDVGYVGGLSRALAVARMADEAGLACTPHNANVTLLAPCTLHLVAGLANAGPYLERNILHLDGRQDMYEPALAVEDGSVRVPQEPGWGVRVRDDWLAGAERSVSEH